jgi:hypothetical protein
MNDSNLALCGAVTLIAEEAKAALGKGLEVTEQPGWQIGECRANVGVGSQIAIDRAEGVMMIIEYKSDVEIGVAPGQLGGRRCAEGAGDDSKIRLGGRRPGKPDDADHGEDCNEGARAQG